jgi:hypothetical protein
VLRKIFWSKGERVTERGRKIHNEELNPLNAELNPICYFLALLGAHRILQVGRIRVYTSPNVTRMIKSRMRWAEYVARIGERRGTHTILVGYLEGTGHLGDPGVGGKIIRTCIFSKRNCGESHGLN